jgi:HD-GYP domain-containing protein (c-di-GMP phosphodiesterase class II)
MLDALLALWRGVAEERRLDGERLTELVKGLARRPGDGVVEPCVLVHAAEPSRRPAAQAINAARLTLLAGREAGATGESLRSLAVASLLADVGMIELPERLIDAPERLSAGSFASVREHPVRGATMLLATPDVPELAAVVAFEHHRRVGVRGAGYPTMPRRRRPAAESRLYAVADVYAALRSPRSFRAAMDEGPARTLVRRLGRDWLDPAMVGLVLDRAASAGCVVTPLA